MTRPQKCAANWRRKRDGNEREALVLWEPVFIDERIIRYHHDIRTTSIAVDTNDSIIMMLGMLFERQPVTANARSAEMAEEPGVMIGNVERSRLYLQC